MGLFVSLWALFVLAGLIGLAYTAHSVQMRMAARAIAESNAAQEEAKLVPGEYIYLITPLPHGDTSRRLAIRDAIRALEGAGMALYNPALYGHSDKLMKNARGCILLQIRGWSISLEVQEGRDLSHKYNKWVLTWDALRQSPEDAVTACDRADQGGMIPASDSELCDWPDDTNM